MIRIRNECVDSRNFRRIELSQPLRANCLSIDMMRAITDAVRSAANHTIVLTGQGKTFCSGLHLSELVSSASEYGGFERILDALVGLYRAILEHCGPTICLVNGPAVAGGAGLAFVADDVVAASSAYFLIPDRIPLLPLIPASILHQRCPVIDESQWIGRRVDGSEAQRLGMVGAVLRDWGETAITSALQKLLKEHSMDAQSMRRCKMLQAVEQVFAEIRSADQAQRDRIAVCVDRLLAEPRP